MLCLWAQKYISVRFNVINNESILRFSLTCYCFYIDRIYAGIDFYSLYCKVKNVYYLRGFAWSHSLISGIKSE